MRGECCGSYVIIHVRKHEHKIMILLEMDNICIFCEEAIGVAS